jgi:hypothetical protein
MKKAWRTFKKWFVPHPENDHRAHILRSRSIAVVCTIAVAAELIFLNGFSLPAFRSSLLGDIVVGALADGTNAARVSNNLPTLQVSPLLTEAAQEKANDMAKNNYFAHTSPAGLTPWYWFGNVGYDFTYAGENLAVDFSDSQDVTTAWLNSPEHRANIMSANFTQVGIAIATGTFEGHPAVYVAEEFGTPSPLMIAAPTLAAVAAKTEAGSLTNLAVAPVVATSATASASVLGKTVAVTPSAPTPIAASDVKTSSSEQMFMSVKSASSQPVSAAMTTTGPTPNVVPAPAPQYAPQTNVVEQAIANPRASIDSFYLFIALLFSCAIAVDIFVKIRTQHPKLITGGLVAISLAGIFILLNQSLFLGVVIK